MLKARAMTAVGSTRSNGVTILSLTHGTKFAAEVLSVAQHGG